MEKTPNSKSKYFKNNNHEENTDIKLNSSTSKVFEIESPGYLSCTQEGFENVDVVWDWNSPQSKRIPKKSQKRLALAPSPKKTLKRHLSNNSIHGFEKLQEELRLLKEEIAIPEHEESLLLSPIEEAEYKDVNESDSVNNIELENFLNENEDFFDDSFDEQLLECTTQIETHLNDIDKTLPSLCSNGPSRSKIVNKVESINNIPPYKKEFIHHTDVCHIRKASNLDQSVRICNNLKLDNIFATEKLESHKTQSLELSNHGHSCALPVSNKEEIERKRKEALAKLELKKRNFNKEIKQPSDVFHIMETTNLDESLQIDNSQINPESDNTFGTVGKVEFHRTQSFELSNFEHLGALPTSKKEEIDRKRKEALAKLDLKKHGNFTISPLQCSSEEIERKRQEALAKREAKRQQEIIERNRQNALKRLEMTRKKNAQAVKSTLTSRLS